MPTPVRVRGKAGNKRQCQSLGGPKSHSTIIISKFPSRRTLSRLELLPNEILQDILWWSFNLDLGLVSLPLAYKLADHGMRRKLICFAFFECVWWTGQPYYPRDQYDRIRITHPDNNGHWEVSQDDQRPLFQHDQEITYRAMRLRQEKLQLQLSIFKQPWFTPGVFYDCQQEYIQRMVPAALQGYLPDDLKSDKPQWSFAKKMMDDCSPGWFRDMSSSSTTGKDEIPYALVLHEHYPSSNAIATRGASRGQNFWDRENLSVGRDCKYWALGFAIKDTAHQGNFFSVGLGEIAHDIWQVDEFAARHLSVKHWTMKESGFVHLTQGLMFCSFALRSAEAAASLSSGLMTAIEQHFLPAVLVLSQTSWTGLEEDGYRRRAQQILEDLLGRIETRFDSEYADLVYFYGPRLRRLYGTSGSASRGGVQLPVETSHVKRALELFLDNPANINAIAIFECLSLTWLMFTIANCAFYPEEMVKEIHATVLAHGGRALRDQTALHPVGRECYKFFSETATALWEAKA